MAAVCASLALAVAASLSVAAAAPAVKPMIVRLAGTLTNSSSLSVDSKDARQGLEFLAQRVNTTGTAWLAGATTRPAFLAADGRPFLVELDLPDDNEKEALVRKLYRNWVQEAAKDTDGINSRPLLLLAPNNPDLLPVAVEEVRDASVDRDSDVPALAVHRGGMLSQNGRHILPSPQVYSLNVPATDLHFDALRVLRGRGARSLLAFWADTPFMSEACQGAMGEAREFGYVVSGFKLGKHVVSTVDILSAMTESRGKMDVVLVCMPAPSAWLLVMAAQMHEFKSLVLLGDAMTQWFADALLAMRVKYIFGLTEWLGRLVDPSRRDEPCPVFGSAGAFASDYEALFGEAPSDAAALAAAAGMALLAAAEKASLARAREGKPSTPAFGHRDVAQALETLNMSSFAGQVSFNDSTGFIADHQSRVDLMQWQKPRGVDESSWDALLKVEALLVAPAGARIDGEDLPNGTFKMVWPKPNMHSEKADPCAVGSQAHFHGDHGECELCQRGKFKNREVDECQDCEPGKFAPQEGSQQCQHCPIGAACEAGRNIAAFSGYPEARPGYFLALGGSDPPYYLPCNPPGKCLGGNRCREDVYGFQCEKCKKGFMGIYCEKCPGRVWPRICFVLFILFLLFWQMVFASPSTNQEFYSVLIITMYDHFQLFCLVSESMSSYSTWRRFCRMVMYPFSSVLDLACVFEGVRWSPVVVNSVLAWLLLPVLCLLNAALSMYLCRRSASTTVSLRIALANVVGGTDKASMHRRYVAAAAQEMQRRAYQGSEITIPEVIEIYEQGRDHGQQVIAKEHGVFPTGLPEGVSAELDPEPGEQDDVHEPAVIRLGQLLLDVRSKIQKYHNQGIHWCVVAFVMYQPMVIRIFSQSICCVRRDVLRLKMDPGLMCEDIVSTIAYVGLIFYGVCIPIFLFAILSFASTASYLDEFTFIRKFGFLYNGLKSEFYYWSICVLFRKTLVVFIIEIQNMTFRVVALLTLLLTSLGLVLHFQPHQISNRRVIRGLEARCITGLFVFVIVQSVKVAHVAFAPIVTVVSLVLLPSLAIGYGYLAVTDFVQLTVLRFVRLKRRFSHIKLTKWENWLLMFMPSEPKFRWNSEACLVACHFSKRDVECLVDALMRLIEVYVFNGKEFHGAYIAAGINEVLVQSANRHREDIRDMWIFEQHAILVQAKQEAEEARMRKMRLSKGFSFIVMLARLKQLSRMVKIMVGRHLFYNGDKLPPLSAKLTHPVVKPDGEACLTDTLCTSCYMIHDQSLDVELLERERVKEMHKGKSKHLHEHEHHHNGKVASCSPTSPRMETPTEEEGKEDGSEDLDTHEMLTAGALRPPLPVKNEEIEEDSHDAIVSVDQLLAGIDLCAPAIERGDPEFFQSPHAWIEHAPLQQEDGVDSFDDGAGNGESGVLDDSQEETDFLAGEQAHALRSIQVSERESPKDPKVVQKVVAEIEHHYTSLESAVQATVVGKIQEIDAKALAEGVAIAKGRAAAIQKAQELATESPVGIGKTRPASAPSPSESDAQEECADLPVAPLASRSGLMMQNAPPRAAPTHGEPSSVQQTVEQKSLAPEAPPKAAPTHDEASSEEQTAEQKSLAPEGPPVAPSTTGAPKDQGEQTAEKSVLALEKRLIALGRIDEAKQLRYAFGRLLAVKQMRLEDVPGVSDMKGPMSAQAVADVGFATEALRNAGLEAEAEAAQALANSLVADSEPSGHVSV
eukprot:TRINITY_DN5953_c0_g1_i1.p1 TRINITY_DN5953_c0_g1~~TRINITY_DN5953_c0_g1_i1.p1  ORF type:complete len:1716 (-),score=301.45 TRINITY_DN5953_c0_g1_i1:29-5149(-)